MRTLYPLQRTTLAEKDEKWVKSVADHIIGKAGFGNAYYDELYTLACGADGELQGDQYKYVLNPFNTEEEKFTYFPAKMRNYDIISPIVKSRLGEMSKKPNHYEVITVADEEDNAFKESLNSSMYAAISQMAINSLNKHGIKTGIPTQPVDPIQVQQEVRDSFDTNRASLGQQVLDYIKYDQDLIDKQQDLYRDWLTFGRCYSYKEVYRDDVLYHRVAPIEMGVAPGSSTFIEDRDWAVWKRQMTLSEIIDWKRHELKDTDIKFLEERIKDYNGSAVPAGAVFLTTEHVDGARSNFGYLNNGTVNVYIINWKTLVQKGILTYIDELKQVQEKTVDETYQLNREAGDLSIEWEWQNETWEVIRIGDEFGGSSEQGIYIGGRPVLAQRSELNNESKCKLNFNGRELKTIKNGISSHVKSGLVYQALYNIYQYQRELLINKNKDKILLLPKGLIPTEFFKDTEDPFTAFMYYLYTTNLGVFDESKPNAAQIIGALKSIDLGLGTYIKDITDIINQIKSEYWDAVGFNRQRYGETYASDGKGANEQALFRSSLITAEEDRQFERFFETEYSGLLDLSKVAYINGKKASYITSDKYRAFLNVNGQEHLEANYGIFCVNRQDEHEKLELFRKTVFPMAQKGNIAPDIVAEIIDANNFSRLKSLVRKADSIQKQMEQQAAKSQQESAERIAKMNADEQRAERASKEQIAADNNDTKIEVAKITAAVGLLGYDEGYNGEEDLALIDEMSFQKEKGRHEMRLKERQQYLAEKKQRDDVKLKEKDQEIKNRQVSVQAKKKATAN